MPIHEYRCPAGHRTEKFFRKMSDAESQTPCTVCGAVADRQMSGAGLVFKGSGFYLTDYGKSGSAAAKSRSDSASESKSESASSATATESGGGESSKSTAAEAKPAAAPAAAATESPKKKAPKSPPKSE